MQITISMIAAMMVNRAVSPAETFPLLHKVNETDKGAKNFVKRTVIRLPYDKTSRKGPCAPSRGLELQREKRALS